MSVQELWAVVWIGYGRPAGRGKAKPREEPHVDVATLAHTRGWAIRKHNVKHNLAYAPPLRYDLLRRRGFVKALRVALVPYVESPEEMAEKEVERIMAALEDHEAGEKELFEAGWNGCARLFGKDTEERPQERWRLDRAWEAFKARPPE